MAIVDSAPFNITVTSVADSPLWMRAPTPMAVGEWRQIPNTSPQTGIGNAAFPDQHGNSPLGCGRLSWSGGALRDVDSRFFLFGGGHADYSGNEIHSISLAEDTPTWRLEIAPTPYTQITPDADYNSDGRPNSMHSGWGPLFVDPLNRMMLFRAGASWVTSNHSWSKIDGFNVATSAWDGPGYWGDPLGGRSTDYPWAVHVPNTTRVYFGAGYSIVHWDNGVQQYALQNDGWGHDKGLAALDTTRNRILCIGTWNGNDCKPRYYDLNAPMPWPMFTGNVTWPNPPFITLDGTYGALFMTPNWPPLGGGLCYAPDIDRFVLFKDDGYTYEVHPDTWGVERLAVTNNPPANSRQWASNGNGIYRRFSYVPQLKGVFYLAAWSPVLDFSVSAQAASMAVATAAL